MMNAVDNHPLAFRQPLLFPALKSSEGVGQRPKGVLHDITQSWFPILADPERLTAFCDEYLNIAPDIARFRPAMPVVYLIVANYGKISQKASMFGWPPHEIVFCVPLEWYDCTSGRPVFFKWAAATPYTFVDNKLAEIRGVEHLGFPERMVTFTPLRSQLFHKPHESGRRLEMTAPIPSWISENRGHVEEVLIQLERRPPPFSTPDLQSFLSLFTAIPKAVRSSATMAATFAGSSWLNDQTVFRSRQERLHAFRETPLRMLRQIWRPPSMDIVSLVQFSAIDDSQEACYQALVETPLNPKHVYASGMLGHPSRLAIDPTAGYRIHLARFPDYPIVDRLGLQVADQCVKDGVTFDICEPLNPSWLSADLGYGPLREIAWRAQGSSWQVEGNSDHKPSSGSVKDGARSMSAARSPIPYNEAAGQVRLPRQEGADLPEAVISVLPLRANFDRLQETIAYLFGELRPGAPCHVSPVTFPGLDGACVFLLISDYRGATDPDSLGGREAAFVVPLEIRSAEGRSHALFAPYVFTDRLLAIHRHRERLGVPVLPARLRQVPEPWRGEYRLLAGNNVLQVFYSEEIRANMESRDPPLMEIGRWRGTAQQNGSLKTIFEQELEAEKLVVPHLAFREHREVDDPALACYQAVTAWDVTLLRSSSGWFDHDFQVTIRRDPQMPISERLGLEATAAQDGGVVALKTVAAPFWVRGSLRSNSRRNLWWRAKSEQSSGSLDGDAMPRGDNLMTRFVEALGG